ncbi:MAG: Holliday junction branch migration DNA helicase RuvB, partial [Candidatus Omnitrophica bacterium]|nr:Holliday junction branch migration DNA helicase RuvB [Candidatus Omnitrophota bacterium]
DLTRIIIRSCGILGFKIDLTGAEEIAKRSRATPRIANRLLRRVRDYTLVKGKSCIDGEIASYALNQMSVDEKGLDDMDKKILSTIIEKFNGGPVGIRSLAIAVGEEPDTIEEVYEAYLVKEGYISRTPQGRVANESAYRHLKIRLKNPPELFSNA